MQRLHLPGVGPAERLADLATRWRELAAASVEPLGLSLMQAAILLALLKRHPEPLSQQEVIEKTQLPPFEVSRRLSSLERAGLSLRPPRVGRERLVSLTKEGLLAAQRARAALDLAERRFLSPLGEQVRLLTAVCKRLGSG